MWEVNSTEQKNTVVVKRVRIVISILLSIGGIYVLFAQSTPVLQSYLKGRIIEMNEEMRASPVPGSYKREIGGEFAYWDPGRSYFENLIAQADQILGEHQSVFNPQTKEYSQVSIDQNYSRSMKLTIKSLEINGLNIASNVESYDENVYNQILKNGIAHFKGTPLPGAGGNSFIYGHSAVPTYFNNHSNNPEVAFTVLENIKIGDRVEIEKDGKIYNYVVRRKRIVDPTDFSILSRQSSKETVTLMTCTPVGIGTNRLVVTAELIDG